MVPFNFVFLFNMRLTNYIQDFFLHTRGMCVPDRNRNINLTETYLLNLFLYPRPIVLESFSPYYI